MPSLANVVFESRFDPQCWYYESSVKEFGTLAFPTYHSSCHETLSQPCKPSDEEYNPILELFNASKLRWKALEFGNYPYPIENCHILLRTILRSPLRASCKHLQKFTYNLSMTTAWSHTKPKLLFDQQMFKDLQEVLNTAAKIEHLAVSSFGLLYEQALPQPYWSRLKKLCHNDSTIE